jgi:hypothetical protein
MKDSAEQSNPSTGSVAGEPIAWGIQFWGGDLHHEAFDTKEQAEREMHRGAPPEVCTARVVALYLKPTLTHAEREAIEWASLVLRNTAEELDQHGDYPRRLNETAALMLNLLQRMK